MDQVRSLPLWLQIPCGIVLGLAIWCAISMVLTNRWPWNGDDLD